MTSTGTADNLPPKPNIREGLRLETLAQFAWTTTHVEFNLGVGGAMDFRIEDFTGQHPVLSPNPAPRDQKTVGVVRAPFQNTVRWTELKPSASVVLGVVKKPGARPWIVHTDVL